MDIKVFLTAFLTVFVAELGDKTQFAVMALAANKSVSPWTVFLAASLGLMLAAGLGVIAGQWLSAWLSPKWLTLAAGGIFIILGALTLAKAWQMH